MAAPARASSIPAVAYGSAVATVGVLPVFLTGGLAVQVAADLEMSEARIGIAVAAYFTSSALASAAFGRWSQRLGFGASLRLAALTGAVALGGLALAASLAWLSAFLVVAGLANAMGQPAANGLIIATVPERHRAFAFAVKQSAIPLATLIGGLAVPAVALTVGWRWAFVGAAAGAVLVAARGTRSEGPGVRGALPRADFRVAPLIVLAGAVAFAAAAANSLGSFVTASAVNIGMGEAAAGWVQVAGSATGLSMRLLVGYSADRGRTGDLGLVLMMMAAGAAGFALLGTESALLFTVGVGLGYGAGWAWPGLFNFAVSHRYASAAAAATGITQTGIYVGGAAGPLAFGIVAERASYQAAWLMVAVCAAVAALGVQAGRVMLAQGAGDGGGVSPRA